MRMIKAAGKTGSISSGEANPCHAKFLKLRPFGNPISKWKMRSKTDQPDLIIKSTFFLACFLISML
jgi:hypothetical protein